ncbi:CRISPR-associated helicase Cas3' [Virgibacillus halodenitrificans]|uniref:CRISPR-associated helicase Cas3 n=1 Tax=Virgibacillus halodenitrificans TaxID=1482 RepID=A0ABR7VJL9_VIRHA|nr:CRISPR-associated helicase Cas3' [Virgibacillus halodenitrificans]MBD1221873.1 CRISPR-associated helicase Cas3' [Virgibacillus halodenitrificans]
MSFVAHIREADQAIQTIEEHLLGVKEIAEAIGHKIGVKHIAGLAGMLHDMGKYSSDFQQYIRDAVENPNEPPKRGSVDHSTAGGKLLFNLFHVNVKDQYKVILAEIVGNTIISHHAYLHDFIDPQLDSPYIRRVRDKDNFPDYLNAKRLFFEKCMPEEELQKYINKATDELKQFLHNTPPQKYEEQYMFLSKYVFSALIDADRTNTRLFEENKSQENNAHSELFTSYYQNLMNKIMSFQTHPAANHSINKLRAEMSNQCDAFAERPSGIYTLSIPTGGGKTLASLRYALKHTIKYNKKRIIYIVPFTTIIEQNAEEVRSILGDDSNLLEHHSNVLNEIDENDEHEDGRMNKKQKLKLAKDNWDSPIIFTTMVQFLEVFYSKSSRNIRRLHNLSEAVIIFDEVQKVPIRCVSLFNQALNFLKNKCHSSLVLCTATQPALDFVDNKLELNSDAEMVQNLNHVSEAFKRVEIIDRATERELNNVELAEWISTMLDTLDSILVIFNTKTVVKDLYQRLKENNSNVNIYHLSTSMCAAHRNQILKQVREDLHEGRQVVCVSSQLIEAGVDVSFECVIRSLAGLDSIAQAAGRCNRHGEQELQQVYVIDHKEENLKYLKEIAIGKRITKQLLIDLKRDPDSHGGNILSIQAMDRFFQRYYEEFETDLNYFISNLEKDMTEILSAPKREYSFAKAYCKKTGNWPPLMITNSYHTAAKYFKVINNTTTSVLVPYDVGKEIITELNGYQRIEEISQFFKKAQHYTINLYKYEIDELDKNNNLVSLMDGQVLALTEGAYSLEYGLDIEGEGELEFHLV